MIHVHASRIAFLTLAFLAPTGIDAEVKPGEAGEADGDGLSTVLVAVRKHYVPLLVFYDGGEAASDADKSGLVAAWREARDDRSLAAALKRLPFATLADADLERTYPLPKPAANGQNAPPPWAEKKKPPTVAERFGLVRGVPSLVFVDFRENVVKRIVEDLPESAQLRRLVAAFTAKNAQLATRAREVEKMLEQSNYSFALGKKRAAVQKVVPLDEPKKRASIDSDLLERVDALIDKYRSAATKLIEKAYRLDEGNNYEAALAVLEDVIRDYPLPDILRRAHKKQVEVLRKLQTGLR